MSVLDGFVAYVFLRCCQLSFPSKAEMTTKDKFIPTFTVYKSIYKLKVNFPIQSL